MEGVEQAYHKKLYIGSCLCAALRGSGAQYGANGGILEMKRERTMEMEKEWEVSDHDSSRGHDLLLLYKTCCVYVT